MRPCVVLVANRLAVREAVARYRATSPRIFGSEKWFRMFGQSFLRINKVTALRFQAAIAAPVLLK